MRHKPTRISYTGDPQAALGYIDQAQHLLFTTQERLRVGGLSSLTAFRRLSGDSYCYCILAGGMQTLHIVAGSVAVAQDAEAVETVTVPDFLSGAIRNGYVDTVAATPSSPSHDTLHEFAPTAPCARAYALFQGWQDVDRLAVKPSDDFGDLTDFSDSLTAPVFSQYTHLKPTMYSGLMRACVQALMGFGRQRRNGAQQVSLYQDAPPPKSTPAAPTQDAQQYAKDVANDGLQIQYDWHFARTHGITRATDGALWLVEIGMTNGIVAMPLPLNPYTTTDAFRAWIDQRDLPDERQPEKNNDDAVLTILDTFGGFPTGEGMPSSAKIDAWVRAGKVLRLATHDDLQPFYQCNAYSTQLGWAFDEYGAEAHNTAWYDHDDGYKRGVHYAVTLQIGNTATVAAKAGADSLRGAFLAVAGTYPDIIDAAVWKLDRLTDSQIALAASLLRDDTASALNYVDALVLTPLASFGGGLHKVGEGALYTPNAPAAGPIIRFPEPALGLLVSFRMWPNRGGMFGPGPIPRCDTIMHVFFAGKDMRWVRYFHDETTAPAQSYNDYEECMFIGSWSAHSDSGPRAVGAAFYTSERDDRVALSASTTDTIITGTSLGYSQISCADNPINPTYSSCTRHKRFMLTTDTTTVYGQTLGTSIAVPFYDREAFYYAVVRGSSSSSHSVTYQYTYLTDPYWCNTWRNFPGFTGNWVDPTPAGEAFVGWMLIGAAQHPDGCGPVTHRTAASPSPTYSPTACSDLANAGPWCHVCDDLDTMSYSIPEPPLPVPVYTNTVSSGTYSVTLVTGADQAQVQTVINVPIALDGSWKGWRLHTPDLEDGFSEDQWMAETCNALGGGDTLVGSSDLHGDTLLRGAPRWDGLGSWPTFIGVLNG